MDIFCTFGIEMACIKIDDLLYHLEVIIDTGDELLGLKINQIETLKMELRFLRTFIKFQHFPSSDQVDKITKKIRFIENIYHQVFNGATNESKHNFNANRMISQMWAYRESLRSFSLTAPDLLEYLDCLQRNLDDLPRYLVAPDLSFIKGIKVLQKRDRFLRQMKIIQRKLGIFRYLYGSKIHGFIDHEEARHVGSSIQCVADNVINICFALWIDKRDGKSTEDIERVPAFFLCQIKQVELQIQKIFFTDLDASTLTTVHKFPKVYSSFLEDGLKQIKNMMDGSFTMNISVQNVNMAIEFLLIFLADVPNHVINGHTLSLFFGRVEYLMNEITFTLPKLQSNSNEMILETSTILEKVELLKADVKEIYRRKLKYSSPSYFPMINELCFIDFLFRKFDEVLSSNGSLESLMKPEIRTLRKRLSHLRSFVGKDEHRIPQELWKRSISVAYEVERIVDSILVRRNALSHLLFSLPSVIKEIDLINKEFEEVCGSSFGMHAFRVANPSPHISTRFGNIEVDEEPVGLEDDTAELFQLLTGGSAELDVISIVGMPGLGKTTLAKRLYNNNKVADHFDVRAWCTISQTYSLEKLLRDIYKQTVILDSKDSLDKVDSLDKDKIADMLRKSLVFRRYLIVLDDIWEEAAWHGLKGCFPLSQNKSRIILTSRLEKIAWDIKKFSDPYCLRFLSREESWELLQKRVYQGESCPPELREVGLQVAEKCKGLPLMIVLIAGIIAKKEKKESSWHEIARHLSSHLVWDQEQILDIIQLSYDHLEDHLKSCFLHMGSFQEDSQIKVSLLFQQWIAEGFLQNTELGSLEEAAEGYLMDLLSCSLVIVSKRSFNGKVKSCHIHDLVREFCLRKAKEGNFIHSMEPYDQYQQSNCRQRRLCLHLKTGDIESPLVRKHTRGFYQHLRSFQVFRSGDLQRTGMSNLFSLIVLSRFLRVLDLKSITLHRFQPSGLNYLLQLRYLAIDIEQFDFEWILDLLYLETLLVSGKCIVEMPPGIWKMTKLRHVDVCGFSFDLKNKKQLLLEGSFTLENLKIFRTLSIFHDDDIDELLERFPNLQELELIILSSRKAVVTAQFDIVFPKLERLAHLESLSVQFPVIWWCIVLPFDFSFPSNLKKLKLVSGLLTAEAVATIARLPNLEVLILKLVSFEQQMWVEDTKRHWDLGDAEFPMLKILKLKYLKIRKWNASETSFPVLEQLVVHSCSHLEEIPPSFSDILTLKTIKVIDCDKYSKSVESSALKIKEEADAITGYEGLQVQITRRQAELNSTKDDLIKETDPKKMKSLVVEKKLRQ